jgi:hypothetical protein
VTQFGFASEMVIEGAFGHSGASKDGRKVG